MSYLDHIRACNRHDLAHFVPVMLGDRRIGWFRRTLLDHLRDFGNVFEVTDDRVTFHPALATPAERTIEIERVARELCARGLTPKWRDEPFPVGTRFGERLFDIERAAVPLFGIRAYGIHVNGFVHGTAELELWIPRRSANLVVAPGRLDNMIAGGCDAAHSLTQTLVKEADEEAMVPEHLARAARPVGTVSYVRESARGLRTDVLFNYDLELPAGFVPRNRDGEVGDFRRMPVAEVMEIVDTSDDFKFNSNLVLIDFFIRHGTLTPGHADYIELSRGLHR